MAGRVVFSLERLFGEDAGVVFERNFQLVLLAALLMPIGNGLMSPILDSLIEPFGASPASIGLVISVFIVPSIVVMPLAGVLADRFGRKTILIPSIVLFGVAGAAIAFTTAFQVILVLRLFQGIAWASLAPLLVTAIGDFYSGKRESTAQGLRLSGSSLAASGFSLLAGVLVVVAWQYPFLVYLISLPIALIVYLWLDEPTAGTDASREPGSVLAYRQTFTELVRHRRVALILVARTIQIIVWIGFTTYNSIIVVRVLGGTPVEAGMLFAVGTLAMAIGASQVGNATEFVGNRYTVLIIANTVLGLGFITIAFAPVLAIAGIGVIAVGACHGVAVTLYRSLITGFAPESIRAGLVSTGEAGARVNATAAPLVMGAIIAWMTPILGFAQSIQLGTIVISIVAGGGGVVLVLIARAMPPVTDPVPEA